MAKTFRLTPTERLELISSSADALEVHAHYGPGGSPPPAHYHPSQQETFTGISGAVTARIGGTERTIGPGDTVVVPPGTSHAFWNAGREEAVLKWEVRPALRTEQMFQELSDAGSTFKQALVIPRYKAEFRLSSAPQRVVLDAIGTLIRR
jgi:quercetin dioxygenase-like cupin family protein